MDTVLEFYPVAVQRPVGGRAHDGGTYVGGSLANERITLAEPEQYLSKAADLLRGSIDQADFKAYIFPLVFFKRIGDMYASPTRPS